MMLRPTRAMLRGLAATPNVLIVRCPAQRGLEGRRLDLSLSGEAGALAMFQSTPG